MWVPDDHGGIMHSELRLADVAITAFSDDGGGYDRPVRKGETIGHGLYVSVADQTSIDHVFASAVEAGATPIWRPGNTEWGNYRCRVHDPEGYEWTFDTHRPGQVQADWATPSD